MNIEDQLVHPSQSFLIVEQREGRDIIIGAPHHAPAGVGTLPCGRDADENTGYLARYLAQKLGVMCVVAVNGKVDPNKRLDTDYSKAILERRPRLLLEIHGHGGRKAKVDVEISAGSKEREPYARGLVRALKGQLLQYGQIKELTVSGDWQKIYFRASNTATIAGNDWLGIHVEMPPKLRLQHDSKEPPAAGYLFCEALAGALVDCRLGGFFEQDSPSILRL